MEYDQRYDRYVAFVSKMLTDRRDVSFKAHPDYRYMLEHVTAEQGVSYWREIKKRFPRQARDVGALVRLAEENDAIGGPMLAGIPGFGRCSPSNLRYIMHAFLSLEHFSTNCDSDAVDLVEIGGGYGGLCFYISKLAHLFCVNVRNYTIFDIREICEHQKIVLSSLGIQGARFAQLDNYQLPEKFFVISNYCFGELSETLRDAYSQRVINRACGGFVTLNYIEFYKFAGPQRQYRVVPERPRTGRGNQYVYF